MKKISLLLLLLTTLFWNNVQAQCNPQFTWAQTLGYGLLNVTVTNTTTAPPPSLTAISSYYVNYGDNTGNFPIGLPANHNYALPGTYTVKMVMTVLDSTTSTIICRDSVMQQVTVAYSPCDVTHNSYNLGSGTYAFAAHSLANATGTTFTWHFGDGSSSTGDSVVHNYVYSGSYNVVLVVAGLNCVDSIYQTINYNNGLINCDSLTASFYSNVYGMSVNFHNTSTYVPFSISPLVTNHATWFFGDGNSSTNGYNYTYAAPGTYTVTLINKWKDSTTQTILCTDTAIGTVTVNGTNYISGHVISDSTIFSPNDSFKVWLIKHDTSVNTLTAIDSTIVNTFASGYTFHNPIAGNYLIKAAPINQTASTTGYIPTYHVSNLYWHTASTVSHGGVITNNKNIVMLTGTPTSGPGFIGGSISLGAGKGTNTGVPNMLVFIRSATNNDVIASTYTDEEGNYSFSNIPLGSYNIYPEAINYNTTPSASIDITAQNATAINIDFEQIRNEILPLSATSIKQLGNDNSFAVYPNPAKDVVNIDNRAGIYTKAILVNLLGQTVQQQTIAKGNNAINIEALIPGIYYLVVSGNTQSGAAKIIKN